MSKEIPAIEFTILGVPKSKENKGAWGGNFYYAKHKDIIDWEIEVNTLAIIAMKAAGFPGPYKGRCKIQATFKYESWKRCDITNYWKSLNDALNGAVWCDDSQVDAAECIRQIDRNDPSITVRIFFYDYSYEDAYPKKKYPDTYDAFSISSNGTACSYRSICQVDDVPASRFAFFAPKPPYEKKPSKTKAPKVRQTKVNRTRRIPDAKKAAAAIAAVDAKTSGAAARKRDQPTSKTRTARKRGSKS